MSYSPLLVQLIDALRCMPGVGQKSAQRIAFHLLERDRQGRGFAIVVVAEGAAPADGSPSFANADTKRLGGICEVLAHQIGERTGKETR